MANCCSFDMMIVSKDKETLDRMFSILQYKDKEFYLYRVQDIQWVGKPHKQNGLWVGYFTGDVAWSCTNWLEGSWNNGSKSETGASYTTLPELCEKLDFGVEIWGAEPGMGFQEYIRINNSGDITDNLSEDWTQEFDDDGNIVDERGGFADYGDWCDPEDVFKPDSRALSFEEVKRLDFLYDEVETFVNKILPKGKSIEEDDPEWPEIRDRVLETVWDCIKDRNICTEREFYPYRES